MLQLRVLLKCLREELFSGRQLAHIEKENLKHVVTKIIGKSKDPSTIALAIRVSPFTDDMVFVIK